MNKENVQKYIQALIAIDSEKAQAVTENFEFVAIEKNTFLLKENQVSRNTYFLESGFVRSYILDNDGNEVTTNIFSAPTFVNDFLSFFKQQPAKENFQALTDCQLWKMDFAAVQKNFHSIPEFREFGRMMLITNYSKLNDRMLGMIKDTAEARYLNLLAQHADIIQNVPLKIIASYLGITDTSLSRIRKDLMKK